MNTKEQYGDYNTYKKIIERTLTEIEDDEITSIKTSCFDNCAKLRLINFPNVTKVGGAAFPIGVSSQLESVLLPSCTQFHSNINFEGCTKLRSVNLHSLELTNNSFFRGCTALTDLDLSSATLINTEAFRETSFEKIVLPSAEYISAYAFQKCNKLKTVDFYGGTRLESSSFIESPLLSKVIIRNSSKVTKLTASFKLSTANFTIYVPDSLVDSYKEATNWSTYADRIKPISELPPPEEEET